MKVLTPISLGRERFQQRGASRSDFRSLFSAHYMLATYFTHFDDVLLDHVFDRPPIRVLMQARSVHACHSRAGLDRPVHNDGAQIQYREQRKHRHHYFGHTTASLGDIE